jgi:hypothetical protein
MDDELKTRVSDSIHFLLHFVILIASSFPHTSPTQFVSTVSTVSDRTVWPYCIVAPPIQFVSTVFMVSTV